jgi:hypothetical protein
MDGHLGYQRFPQFAVSAGKFSIAFRVIAGEYFDYADALEKEQGVSGCPTECPKSRQRFDPRRKELCKSCPRLRQMKMFREETLERWELWFKAEARKFNFDSMLNTFYSVVNFDSLPDHMISVKNASLVSIYRAEKAKARARLTPQPGVAG